jgi:hypothetical protein
MGLVPYNERWPAPVLEAVSHGTSVEYLTLIVPARQTVPVATSDVSSSEDGFALTVRVRNRTERVEVRGDAISLRRL